MSAVGWKDRGLRAEATAREDPLGGASREERRAPEFAPSLFTASVGARPSSELVGGRRLADCDAGGNNRISWQVQALPKGDSVLVLSQMRNPRSTTFKSRSRRSRSTASDSRSRRRA